VAKSTVSISKEHFAPFIEAKAELDKKIKAEGEKAVKSFFKEYFDKHPEVYGVKWMQYTPYFNDGDACVFSLSGVYTFATKEAFENSEESLYDTEGAEECYNEEPQSSLEQIEDILEAIFGDHAMVAVTRTKIETEEYEHD
jgi:hypothetical protein